MAYSKDEFVSDVIRSARIKHLAYHRDQFIIARWYAEFSGQIPNDDTPVADGLTGQQITNIIVRATENTSDMEAGGNAKLNTILQVSDLPLGS
jgi:hypothetical protein